MHRFAIMVFCIILLSVSARGQIGSAPSEKIPATVQHAEEEGAAFPHEGVPASLTENFQSITTPGTSERKCVEVPTTSGIQTVYRRSGEFIVGGLIGDLTAGKPNKVWWAPMHEPGSRKATLLVRSSRLDQPEITSRFSSSNYGWPVIELRSPPSESIVDREHAFYPSGFNLPSAGRWLLVVTSANDWGCFVVTVHT